MLLKSSHPFWLALVLAGSLALAATAPAEACVFSQAKGSTSTTTVTGRLPGWLASWKESKPSALLAVLGIAAAGSLSGLLYARRRAAAAADADPFAVATFPIPAYLDTEAADATAASAESERLPVR